MPFLPPSVTIDRVYTNFDIYTNIRPQHQQIIYDDPEDRFSQRLTIYMGEIAVEHGTGDASVSLNFQYPVLGFFNAPGGGVAVGILPINDIMFNQFRSSIAMASINKASIKDDEAGFGVNNIAADLYQVELEGHGVINSVVLSGSISSNDSFVQTITYNVSVLERMNQNPPFLEPILFDPGGSGGWTGKYTLDGSGTVGSLIRNGIPQS